MARSIFLLAILMTLKITSGSTMLETTSGSTIMMDTATNSTMLEPTSGSTIMMDTATNSTMLETTSGSTMLDTTSGSTIKSTTPLKTLYPQNVIAMVGTSYVYKCSGNDPFRWYRYLPTNIYEDKVIFMGSKMAYNVEENYKVYAKSNKRLFDILNLEIDNIQLNHFGTYKCQKSYSASCAELIVMGGNPQCDYSISSSGIDISCKINITENGIPHLKCQSSTNVISASCEKESDKLVNCVTKVPSSVNKYECTITITSKPLFKYLTCSHATNDPDYKYIWQFSPHSDNHKIYYSVLGGLSCILFIIIVITYCIYFRKRFHRRTQTFRYKNANFLIYKKSYV